MKKYLIPVFAFLLIGSIASAQTSPKKILQKQPSRQPKVQQPQKHPQQRM